ncbi:Rieske 2Fe-2S domain-containing protein [Candidatus Solirubrobacter pratensis]|uniref:Rieske 2Fe-2S domain-containing protein n=1 Tax=Candidatus Solirubrobacter pratensis TaxID=1298857 RepID=UPI000419E4BC|nr:Rieske 2Fe-2S domain-containing protein [Candidatus Solirubrobacter pratensis]
MPDSPRKQPPSKYTADRSIPGAFEGETVTRRRLMTLTVHGAGAVAASAFALPALGFAIGSAVFERPPVRWEAVGAPGDFPNDNYLPRVITTVEGIGEVGKTTVYMRARNADDDPKDAGVQPFIAISNRCMHLGCPVRWTQAASRFICPCHGGVYGFKGEVTGGPPVRPLDHFYTRVRNGQVEVGPRYSVNSEFKRFPSYRDPGQGLDGLSQYVYPGRFSTPKQ